MILTETNSKIEILPEHIIDQIKAGEVLERPASLLKELIENSLDAKSTEINIHLIEQGMDLLSIEDNGTGMNFENLPYAFLRHATSKLKSFEDLYHLRSFGFRGEALASVASSARVTCTSQPQNLNEDGGKIVINGGHTELLVPQKSSNQGTSIYIKDLFFNTPARLKFIKSKVSEKASLKKMIYSFVLSHPNVTFGIKWDEKEKEIFKAVDKGSEHLRVAQVFYSKKHESTDLQICEQVYDQYKVKVFFTLNTYTTPQYRHHYLFVNKRFFQDKSLHSAMLRNLDTLWRFGESGHYYIDITTPPEDVDVNVHPNKTQIKFLRSDVIYSLLVTSIKSKLAEYQTQHKATDLNSVPSTPLTFFSQSDKQDLHLQSLGLLSQNFSSEETSSLFTSYNEMAEGSNHPLKFFGQFLIINPSHPKLIDLKKWLARFFVNGLIQFVKDEEVANPLLISEPFKKNHGTIDKNLNELKRYGFEFDRLNQEFLVLRTIPAFIPQALIQMIGTLLLEYFDQNTTYASFDQHHLLKYFEQKINTSDLDLISDSMLEKLSNEHTLSDDSTYCKSLTIESFQKMFLT